MRFAGGTQAGNALVGAIRTQQLEEGRLEREDIERSLRKERQKEGKKTRFLQQASACYSVVGPSRKPSARVGPSGKRGDVVKKGKKGKKITSWSTKQTNVTAERSERHALLMEVASREQSMELARQAELMGILDPKELRRAREAVGILQAAGRDKVMRLQTELGTVTLMDEITYLQHTVGGAAPPPASHPHRGGAGGAGGVGGEDGGDGGGVDMLHTVSEQTMGLASTMGGGGVGPGAAATQPLPQRGGDGSVGMRGMSGAIPKSVRRTSSIGTLVRGLALKGLAAVPQKRVQHMAATVSNLKQVQRVKSHFGSPPTPVARAGSS